MSLLNNPFDPAREAALVTGAGNGIGRAIAQALVGEGVRTVFADVNADTVAAAVKDSPRPELAVPWVGDLANRAACDALLAQAQSAIHQGEAAVVLAEADVHHAERIENPGLGQRLARQRVGPGDAAADDGAGHGRVHRPRRRV